MTEPHRNDEAPSGASYVGALVALLCLTGLSFGLSFLHLQEVGPVIALAIAAIKVVIVATIFMELYRSVAAIRIVGVVVILWVAILCLGIFADVGFR